MHIGFVCRMGKFWKLNVLEILNINSLQIQHLFDHLFNQTQCPKEMRPCLDL